MSLQSLPIYSVPFGQHPRIDPGLDSSYSSVIDAAGEKYEVIFEIPKAGTVSHLCFMTGTVTNAQTLRVGLETLDSTGNASGTQYGGSAVGTQASPAATTYYEVALGTNATVTKGDKVALVIQFDGTVGNLQIKSAGGIPTNFPYSGLYTTAWAKSITLMNMVGIKYNDGTYGQIYCLGMSADFQSVTFNTGSTSDERGNRFSLPFPAACTGIWAIMSAGLTSTFDLILYDDASTVLKTVSIDPNMLGGTTTRQVFFLFTTPYNLAANTVYRLVVKPTSINSVGVRHMNFFHNNALDTMPGGKEMYLTTRADAGAWTDTNTSRMFIGPILNAFDDGVGGGGGPVGNNMRGGFLN